MIKPEDLGLIQSLVRGEDVSDKLQTGFDFDIDKEEENRYNIYMPSRKAGKSYLARQSYMEQKARERKENEQRFKENMKERNRERRKQVGKEVKTKRDCNI